jgi:hypothetical protein
MQRLILRSLTVAMLIGVATLCAKADPLSSQAQDRTGHDEIQGSVVATDQSESPVPATPNSATRKPTIEEILYSSEKECAPMDHVCDADAAASKRVEEAIKSLQETPK